jgi:hypothetical protein
MVERPWDIAWPANERSFIDRLFFVERNLSLGFAFGKFHVVLRDERGRFPVVADIHPQFSVSPQIDFMKIRRGENPRALDSADGLLGPFRGGLSSRPQIVSGFFEKECEARYRDSAECRPHLSMSEDLSDFKRNGDKYVIWLAMLGCAVLCGIAYGHIDGKKYKQANKKQNNRDRHGQQK